MISNMKIYILEVIFGVVFLLLILMLQSIAGENVDTVVSILNTTSNNIFQLNIAIVVAFAVGLIMSKAFSYKGRDLKKIARGSTALVFANSTIMVLYPVAGIFSVVLILPTFVGNLIKFWSIAKNILEVI